ncbi:MAG: hypothetical protein OEW19_20440 [Acidobacteriota bacterium]|nr:hypothetical protein [Acidobacteriota bacterium]
MHLPALFLLAALAGPSSVLLDGLAALPSRRFAPCPASIAAEREPPAVGLWRDGGPRIRAVDARVSALLASGLPRSSLLRRIVDRVESGDVIVYVGIDPAREARLAGRVTFLGNGGPFRYLRAMINPDLPHDTMIAALAHELYHVVEVVDSPRVRSETALVSLYRRIGRRSDAGRRQGWETQAARQVTDDVRRELSKGDPATVARRDAVDAPAGAIPTMRRVECA